MPSNNETTTKFKVDISELKKAMQDAKKQTALANSEFKAVSSSMDDWRKSTEGLEAKLKQLNSNLDSQQAVLDTYQEILEEVKREYGENSDEAQEYMIKLNNQRAVVNNIEREIRNYSSELDALRQSQAEAGDSAENASDGVDELRDSIEDAGDSTDEAESGMDDLAESTESASESASNAEGGFTVLKGALANLVAEGISYAIEAFKDLITTTDTAMNTFQTKTGLGAESVAQFEEQIKELYKNNYGESLDDIAEQMSKVVSVTGELDPDKVYSMTENGLAFRDAYGYEMEESLRAVNAMMNQFGISADTAYDFLVQGAQNGLDQNGDLLDTINEYSNQFANAGYSAKDMFNMLANGVDSGTWSVDKLGDAIKEYNIRMSDGTALEALEALGLNAEEVTAQFGKGGQASKDATAQIITALQGVEDEQERYLLGQSILGTMWEDLGETAVYALMDTDGAISATNKSMEELKQIKYDDVANQLSGIGRTVKTDLIMPLVEQALPYIKEGLNWITSNLPAVIEKAKEVGGVIKNDIIPAVMRIPEKLKELAPIIATVGTAIAGIGISLLIGNITSVIGAIKTCTLVTKAQAIATNAMAVAQKLFNIAMNANPIALIVTLIATLVVAFISLWNTSEDFRNFWINLWEKIKELTGIAIQAIGKFFTETLPQAINDMLTFLGELGSKVWTCLVNVINKVSQWAIDMGNKAKTTATNFINTVVTFFSQLPSKIWTWLLNVISKVTEWATQMINKAKTTAQNFVNKIIEFIKNLPVKIWTWLLNVINKVAEWSAQMIIKAKTTATNFVNKIIEFISQLPSKMWNIFSQGVSKVVEWGTSLAQKGKEAGLKLLNAVVDTVKGIPSKMLDIGKNIVEGVWNGINGATQWIKDKISGWVGNVTDFLKNLFGIHSPSTLMRDEIGKWLPEGMAVGIDKNAKSVLSSMKNLATETVGVARDNLQSGSLISGGLGGSVINNFNQVINSPKQLSRIEIYRQSKNLLNFNGGVR